MYGEVAGGGIFALRSPHPYSRHCEEIVAGMQRRLSFAPTGASTGTANGRITTRRAASLRPPRDERIGFKPPYSKRENAAKGSAGSSSFSRGKEGLIKKFHLSKMVATQRAVIDNAAMRSFNRDAARHVATKTVGSGIDGPSAGKGVRSDMAFM